MLRVINKHIYIAIKDLRGHQIHTWESVNGATTSESRVKWRVETNSGGRHVAQKVFFYALAIFLMHFRETIVYHSESRQLLVIDFA